MDEIGLNTEWCGITENGVREPKSFSALPAELKAKAYHALTYLLGDPYDSRDVQRIGKAKLNQESGFFFDLLLADSIIAVSELLMTTYRPQYLKQSELRTSVKGRISFIKTIRARNGLLDKHFCEFPAQSFDHEIFGFLKVAIPALSLQLERRSSTELALRLKNASSFVFDVTRETRIVFEPHVTAVKIILNRLVLKPELRALLPVTRIIAHYFLGQRVGLESSESEVKGLILNLNRPFEKLLLRSVGSTSSFCHDREPINELYFRRTNGEVANIDPMRPDCKGFIKSENRTTYLLLDAKHKFFIKDGASPDDPGIINRADLYQVLSYGLTSKHKDSSEQIVALIGLAHEYGDSSTFVTRLPDLCIDYGVDTFSVQRYTLSFSNALVAISNALETTGDPNVIYQAIGRELLTEMGFASAFRKIA